MEIASLFISAFEAYPDNAIYYNQVPDQRVLIRRDQRLIGHLGLSHRMIRVGRSIFSVFGITDMCVAPDVQFNKIGSRLIDEVAHMAEKHDVAFLILTSEINDFYLKNDFVVVQNPCRWLVIHDHTSFGVLRRTLEAGLMVRRTGDHSWPEGEVDFMGHMF